ncbi:MAG: hypothetical protein ACRD96_13800 [Bryobacteraceae bacterium]
MFRRLGIRTLDFRFEGAAAAARLSRLHPELSLGDRACLAAAGALGRLALSADRAWRRLRIGIKVEFIR